MNLSEFEQAMAAGGWQSIHAGSYSVFYSNKFHMIRLRFDDERRILLGVRDSFGFGRWTNVRHISPAEAIRDYGGFLPHAEANHYLEMFL